MLRNFKNFKTKKIKLSSEDAAELTEAKESGVLHGKLLDRREKMKADRYCK